jgi:hypothetical protein
MDYKTLMGYGKNPKQKKVIKENKKSITEGLKKQFGGLTEGPSYEYRKHLSNIKKSSTLHSKSVLDFYDTLRKKGLDKEATSLLDAYKKNMVTFKKTFDKIVRKLL